MSCHVAVLMGGMSAEREVSLVSGEACARALEERGYQVTRLDVGPDLAQVLAEVKPVCCFNALHGRFGEDGRVQGVLDLLGIPYTHSGVLASALAMDKPLAKRLFSTAGLLCPEGVQMTLGGLLREGSPIEAPFVVKPAAEGSSIGVSIMRENDLSSIAMRNDLDLGQRVLIERYIPGRELTTAVLGGTALAVTEIAPKQGFYDYRAKYTEGLAVHVVPADIPEAISARAIAWAEEANRLLGCRGISRADFRYNPEGEEGKELFLLEVNTQPGMTPLSLAPEQAAHRGISFADLVVGLVAEARCDR